MAPRVPKLTLGQARRLRLVHLLRAISVDLESARDRFGRTHQLSDTDIRALIALLDADRAGTIATPGWLGGELGLTSASTTELLDRLSRGGYVERQPDPSDRRRVRLRVTDDAVSLGWEFFGPLLLRMTDALAHLDAPSLDLIDDTLRRLTDAVREARSDPGR